MAIELQHKNIFKLFIWGGHNTHMAQCMNEGQTTIFGSQFSPSIIGSCGLISDPQAWR